MNGDLRETIALFRMSLIGDLIVPGLSRPERRRVLREKAKRIYAIPGTNRTRVAESTLMDWVRRYEQGGLEALKPPYRCDKGRGRSLPQPLADAILTLREEDGSRSVHTILAMLRHAGKLPEPSVAPPSTVYRLLASRGLSKRARPTPKKDRRAFCFEHPNQLWQSDVMYGPMLPDPRTGRPRRTYLIALLDDATRVIPHAAFCFSEKLVDFLPVFRQALLKRGLPERLFVDNGAAFVATPLAVTCAALRIALIHARPYSPQSKGKIERWFRTVRLQLLSQLDLAQLDGIDALNARLWAWIEGEYHRSPHKGLDAEDSHYPTPLDRWMLHAEGLRPAPADIDEHFLVRAQRRVHRDRTVHVESQVFEAPAEYVGESVELRYEHGRARLREIYLYVQGARAHTLRTLDLHSNTRVRRERADDDAMPCANPSNKPSGLNYVELVHQAHAAQTTPQGGTP